MNAVRSVVVAVALVGGPVARAADVLGPPGLVQIVPVGPVVGGGPAVDLYLLALNPDGSPMTGLSLKTARTVGLDSRWTEVGAGVYRVAFAPPAVGMPSQVSVSAKGRSSSRAKIATHAPIEIRPDDGLQAGTGEQVALTLGRDSEIVLPVTGASASGVLVRASAGTATVLPDGQVRYMAPKLNYPHVAVLTFADAADPLVRYRSLSLQLNGSVEYPLKALPGASVSLVIGDRTFGPVLAGSDGKARVPVEVPPGFQQATQITTFEGQESRQEIDLKIPETRRLALVPLPAVLPADAARIVPVRVVVRTPGGKADESAAPVFTASAGTTGPVTNLGEGVYQTEWRLPQEGAEASIEVGLGDEIQKDALTVALVQRRPVSIRLTPSVSRLGPETDSVDIAARLTDASGELLRDAELVIAATGAEPVGDAVKLPSGEYWFTLETEDDSGPVAVVVRTGGAPSTNPVRALVVAPEDGRVTNDGSDAVDLVVGAVDAQGLPVSGAKVDLDLVQGDGSIASSRLTTGRDGIAHTSYVAGTTAGLVGIRATATAGVVGYGTLLQVPQGVAPVTLPVSGTARDVALVQAWTGAVGTLTIPRGEGPAVAGTPTGRVDAEVTSHITLGSDAPTATPGSTITVSALFVPPPLPPASEGEGEGRDEAPPVVPELVVTGAEMGTPKIADDGTVTVVLRVPDDASGPVEVTAKAAGLVETLTLALASTDPWVGATPVVPEPVPEERVVPEEPVREPTANASERRWFRGRLSALASSYLYEQAPSSEPGPLLPSRLAVGGADGGNPAYPTGGELDLRAWGDPLDLPWLGAHGQVRLASYGIQSSAFDRVVKDVLANVEVDLLGRYPFEAGGNAFWVGGKLGFHYNDFVMFTGCVDASCAIGYEAVTVPGIGLGPEVGAELGALHLLAGYTAGFASLRPYAHGVDLNAGYEFLDGVFADLGFSALTRSVVLQGADSGIDRGVITDSQIMGKLGIGFAL